MTSVVAAVVKLQHEVAELQRRNLGRRREGKVVEIDEAAGRYKVEFREGFLSPWIPAEALAAGAVKIQAEPVVGQAVVVTSESGDMTDAVVSLSSFTDDNPRPHGKAGELKITVVGTAITATGDECTIESETITLIGNVQINGDSLRHNDKEVGDTHTHGGIATGSSSTDVPD